MDSITTQPQSVKLTQSTIPIGTSFGRLTVVGPVICIHQKDYIRYYYPCRCSCSIKKNIAASGLLGGCSTSCGCYRLELLNKRNMTHGLSSTRLYKIWKDMRRRCRNTARKDYHTYGGRGISVCAEWGNFVVFREWALTHGYTDELSIDRIDNDGGYSPDNCRWTTIEHQRTHRRTNHLITIFGETKSMKEWSMDARCCVSYQTLLNRINTLVWDAERAVTWPAKRRHDEKYSHINQ